MSSKIIQMEMPLGVEKKKVKTREEILESQVKLQFHEIKMCQEIALVHHDEIKRLNEILSELYIRKTP